MGTTELDANTLNTRQRSFVIEYVKDQNATQAAIRAGYSTNSAKQIAHRLMGMQEVRAAIADYEAAALEQLRGDVGISLASTLTSIARSALYDPRKLFHPDGRPKDITELDDDTAMAIEGIEVVEQYQGSGEERVFTGYVKKYKLARRSAAQDMLMKHLGGYKADDASKGAGVANALVNLLASMRRSALPIVERVDHDELV